MTSALPAGDAGGTGFRGDERGCQHRRGAKLAALQIGAKGVFAAVLGNGFEFFDFTVYATYLGMIGQAFFPSDNVLASDLASAATFGVGFIARPLGGAVIGAYGDRVGEGRR